MVILGGFEIVAAGYLIHKHQQIKKDRAIREEEEAVEEYRRRHPKSEHRRHRSHSRRRHSRERRHSYSYEGKNEYRPRPTAAPVRPLAPVAAQQQVPPPSMAPQSMAQPSMRPPPSYNSVPTAAQQPPQDIKYGWTDAYAPQHQPSQQDPNFPQTGWPAHWPQSRTPDAGAHLAAPGQGGRSYRGRFDGRAASVSPQVRFAVPRRQRSPSLSPPPSYRE